MALKVIYYKCIALIKALNSKNTHKSLHPHHHII